MRNFFLILINLSFFSFSIFSNELSLTLTQRQTCDLELIMNGGFAPLTGFMCRDDYYSVLKNMRLNTGVLWPIPINLDISESFAKSIQIGTKVLLKSQEGHRLAILNVEDVYKSDKFYEAKRVFGSTDLAHPGVNFLINETKEYYIGGKIDTIALPKYYDFNELRKTPKQLKKYFEENNIKKVVAFQTRNPMHRAHFELTKFAMEKIDGHLLLHPVVGTTKPGDIDHFTRVKCYKHLIKYYPANSATLSLLPISMRMAGPREALWHAIIRKNYGATHFIIGRDHAGPGKDSNGNDFYGPYDAQDLVKKYEDELGIKIIPFKNMVYVKRDNKYYPEDETPQNSKIQNISGTEFRRMLTHGLDIPSWFSFPEVISELRKNYKVKSQQGFTIFLTGLPSSGKTTIANALAIKLTEIQNRPITLLDGDIIRTHLSSELGFSKEHRSINVRRVGFVAKEITKNGGIAICSLVSPYESDRNYNRSLIQHSGGYIEIYISTPLSVCEQRDVKGLYELAKEGKISSFTGISDPYESPKKSELNIDTSKINVDEVLELIVSYLSKLGYLNE